MLLEISKQVSLTISTAMKNGKILIAVYSEDNMLDFYFEDAKETVSYTFENSSVKNT